MATKYKNAQLAGVTGGTGVYSNLYSPLSTSASATAVVSSLVITNRSGAARQYRAAIGPASASASVPTTAQFVVYDATIAGYDTVALTLGLTLSESQVLRVSSSTDDLTFSAYISEITP
jgi:hypothetical protein